MTTTLYREKHVVARERNAWAAGVEWTLHHFGSAMLDASLGAARREYPDAANKAYPLPTIIRPRVLRDPHVSGMEWLAVDGELKLRSGINCCTPTAERVRMWTDLLANPNETVDDES